LVTADHKQCNGIKVVLQLRQLVSPAEKHHSLAQEFS